MVELITNLITFVFKIFFYHKYQDVSKLKLLMNYLIFDLVFSSKPAAKIPCA